MRYRCTSRALQLLVLEQQADGHDVTASRPRALRQPQRLTLSSSRPTHPSDDATLYILARAKACAFRMPGRKHAGLLAPLEHVALSTSEKGFIYSAKCSKLRENGPFHAEAVFRSQLECRLPRSTSARCMRLL